MQLLYAAVLLYNQVKELTHVTNLLAGAAAFLFSANCGKAALMHATLWDEQEARVLRCLITDGIAASQRVWERKKKSESPVKTEMQRNSPEGAGFLFQISLALWLPNYSSCQH